MNNSFARLIDGMNATLRSEVLSRLDDSFARGQVFGVINLLNTFKVRADWSAGFLTAQIDAQRAALLDAEDLARGSGLGEGWPSVAGPAVPASAEAAAARGTIDALLAERDAGNRAIADWLHWLDATPGGLPDATARAIEKALRAAMRAEVDLELKHSPRPLFSEMSSGREG